MNLLNYLLKQTRLWAFVFPQERSQQRALALAFGILCGVGKRTLTRAISFQGNTQKDWSADYKVFSRSPWQSQELFHPIIQQAIAQQHLQRIVLSVDDTRVWRNGKHVPQTQWHRDPLGPAFQTNLRWGHRFLQASLVLPLYQQDAQSSSRSIPVRFEMAPVGYRISKNGRKFYRQPAYLLTTDLTTPAVLLLQDYFDRWGIEVNHRDEKEILGVGEAQVWNKNSVSKVPALLVAMYSWLLLAGLHCYGPQRTQDYEPLPKWRRGAKRPSCLDLVTLLRKQLAENPHTFATGSAPATYQTMVGAAAA